MMEIWGEEEDVVAIVNRDENDFALVGKGFESGGGAPMHTNGGRQREETLIDISAAPLREE